MYQRFHKVYSDMEKVDSLGSLEHPASIQEFMKLMPTDSRKKYVELRLDEKEKGTSELEIVKVFMQTERRYQNSMQQLDGEEAMDSNISSSN